MLYTYVFKIKQLKVIRSYGSLALAFNSNEYSKLYKKYEKEKVTGLFNLSDLKIISGFISMRYKAQNDCVALLRESLSSMRHRKMVEILDDMSDSICRVADLSECMSILHPDDSYRRMAAVTSQEMSKLVENLNTNQDLFLALDSVISKNKDIKSLDDVDIRVGRLLHADFMASGINLDSGNRSKFVEETQTSIKIGSSFYEGTQSPVNIKASFLPKKLQESIGLMPEQNINITHSYALTNDPNLREMGFRLFYQNNPSQEELLKTLMEARYNVAKCSGFSSYAERANIHLICENSGNIQKFLNNLSSRLLPFAEADRLNILEAKYKTKLNKQDLYSGKYQILPWDFQFYMNSVKQAVLPGNFKSYSPYLSLGNCMEGINALFQSQFGVRLEVEETIPGELWHPDVFKVSVQHKIMGHLGTVYCDMFSRPGKPSTDCHYTIRAGKQLSENEYQSPIVVLHSSLTPVSPDLSLAFLSPDEVETLFHEWGHALHSLLARTRYQHVAGTRCSTDLAEAPSTLMEHFALDSRILKEYARHHQTGEALPEKMIIPLSHQRYICSALNHQMTIINSMFDQLIHGHDLPLSNKDSCDVYNGIFTNDSIVVGSKVFDLPESGCKLYWPQRFGHLFNYGAKFYSYLISNCISAFLWRNGFQFDPWSSSVGDKYMRTILQHGGERKPLEMIGNFANSENITIDSLVDGFIEDLEINYNKNKWI